MRAGGTDVNDDPLPALTITDVLLPESSGLAMQQFVFTVTLNPASSKPVCNADMCESPGNLYLAGVRP